MTKKTDQLLQQKILDAFTLHKSGRVGEAQAIYLSILKINPTHFDSLQLFGLSLFQTGRYQDAIKVLTEALQIKSNSSLVLNHRGLALNSIQKHKEAILDFNKAISISPDFFEAYNNRGMAFWALKMFSHAINDYSKAIDLKRDFAEAYCNRGSVFAEIKQFEKALADLEIAISLNPRYAKAIYNKAKIFNEQNDMENALINYDKAIALKPDYAEAYSSRGNALLKLKHLEDALASYGKAIAIKPDIDFLLGTYLHTKMKACDWTSFNENLLKLEQQLQLGEKITTPFVVLGLTDSPELQLLAAKIFVDSKYPRGSSMPFSKSIKNDKIRVGYYSADFHNHATAYLMAELFQLHNKEKFEVFAFSFGPNSNDEMRLRLKSSFSGFYDVRLKADRDIISLSRQLNIDIAVDLKGYTQDCRPGIFAEGCAPVQISYLGYPGTMGIDYIDYLIGDRTVVSEETKKFLTEKIIYMPNSYQVNDRKRKISDRIFTKQELGLPENGFVYCCFNNNYKILPSMLDSWIRILEAVGDSILWLLSDNPTAEKNLRKEALARGLDDNRLIFASRMKLDEHLARYKFADLFIDTLPYNAHTTASDALWAGLPVLTLAGKSFASRVAASLLTSINMPELITNSTEEYEALAIRLGRHPEKIKVLKDKLLLNCFTTPLFDTELFTGHLEKAYEIIYQRYQDGLLPTDIQV